MASIFGISTSTIGRAHRTALEQVFQKSNSQIQEMFPLDEIKAAIKANHMETSIEATRRTFEDPKKRPRILARMSRGHKRSYRKNPELRKKISLASTGRHHTEETKTKIKVKLRGRRRPPEVFATTRGRKRTPEVREKISISHLRRLQDPIERQMQATYGFRGKKHSKETKIRMSNSAIKSRMRYARGWESSEDLSLWKYAKANNLLARIIESGFLTSDEANALKEHFEKGRRLDNPGRLLNQFSLGIANLD